MDWTDVAGIIKDKNGYWAYFDHTSHRYGASGKTPEEAVANLHAKRR